VIPVGNWCTVPYSPTGITRQRLGDSYVIRRAIDDIEDAHLATLVSNGVAEGRSLEFKRELPGNSDAEVKEFLAP
jgi:hypothetical protein